MAVVVVVVVFSDLAKDGREEGSTVVAEKTR